MRNVVKPECRHGCRFIQISDSLWLCPHASYGSSSYLKGAVEAARRALEQAGGYIKIVAALEAVEVARAKAREEERDKQRKRLASSVRYR